MNIKECRRYVSNLRWIINNTNYSTKDTYAIYNTVLTLYRYYNIVVMYITGAIAVVTFEAILCWVKIHQLITKEIIPVVVTAMIAYIISQFLEIKIKKLVSLFYQEVGKIVQEEKFDDYSRT